MKRRYYLIIYACALSFCGCAVINHWEDIRLLNALGTNEIEISKYIKRQEKLYKILISDIENNRLVRGIKYSAIIARYGDPITRKQISISEYAILYRRPMEYFNTDRVFLYLDKNDCLISWEIIFCDGTIMPKKNKGNK